MRNRLAISFSGGETSARMTHALMTSNDVRAHYEDIVIQFANTGQEDERTLIFVDRCARYFGWNVVWVEADVQFRIGSGTGARVVTFETASRDGAPFEDMIAKYGIPNSKFPHCTRSLKQHPMQAHLRSVGWQAGSYDTAIGIRADEFDRCAPDAKKRRLIYPLAHKWPMTKPEINEWWKAQPFRLGMKGYQGNCRFCWKKSFRKHMTLMEETPEIYAFPERMEQDYNQVGPEFAKESKPGYRRTFFRENRSVQDIRDMLAEAKRGGTYRSAADDADWTDPTVDGSAGGCGEACDAFGSISEADLAEMLS